MVSARHTTNRQSFKKVTCPFILLKGIVSAPIGEWERNFPRFEEIMTDGRTNQQTNQQTNRRT